MRGPVEVTPKVATSEAVYSRNSTSNAQQRTMCLASLLCTH